MESDQIGSLDQAKLLICYKNNGLFSSVCAHWRNAGSCGHVHKKKDVTALNSIYGSLLVSYQDDAEKYARNATMATILRHCIETSPFAAGQRITFAGFGQSNYRSREIGEALRTLQRAMLIKFFVSFDFS